MLLSVENPEVLPSQKFWPVQLRNSVGRLEPLVPQKTHCTSLYGANYSCRFFKSCLVVLPLKPRVVLWVFCWHLHFFFFFLQTEGQRGGDRDRRSRTEEGREIHNEADRKWERSQRWCDRAADGRLCALPVWGKLDRIIGVRVQLKTLSSPDSAGWQTASENKRWTETAIKTWRPNRDTVWAFR